MDLESNLDIQTVKEATQRPSPIYYHEQIDQLILTPESRANVITRKRPRMIRKPIYDLDTLGDKIPIVDEKGNTLLNNRGELQYVIKDYKEEQDGFEAVLEVVPASEIFSVDNATSNISQEAVKLLTRTYWFYNHLSVYQTMTKLDYSVYLHKLRNDATTVLQASKSYNGGIIQMIKTFINKTDSKQWLQTNEQEKKSDLFSSILGGNKKKKPDIQDNQKFTSY